MSRIPESPRYPNGPNRPSSIWHVAGIGGGIVVIAYLVLTVSVWVRGNATGFDQIDTSCERGDLIVRVNDTPHQIKKGEATVVKLEKKQIEWRCSQYSHFEKSSCVEEANYLVTIGYPDSYKFSLRCDRSKAN